PIELRHAVAGSFPCLGDDGLARALCGPKRADLRRQCRAAPPVGLALAAVPARNAGHGPADYALLVADARRPAVFRPESVSGEQSAATRRRGHHGRLGARASAEYQLASSADVLRLCRLDRPRCRQAAALSPVHPLRLVCRCDPARGAVPGSRDARRPEALRRRASGVVLGYRHRHRHAGARRSHRLQPLRRCLHLLVPFRHARSGATDGGVLPSGVSVVRKAGSAYLRLTMSIETKLPSGTELREEIERLRKERNAVILAHYYQKPELQDLADFVGDSLELSRKAAETDADVIAFCGV